MEVDSCGERKPVIDQEFHIIPLLELQLWARKLAVGEYSLPHRASDLPILPGQGDLKPYSISAIDSHSRVAACRLYEAEQ